MDERTIHPSMKTVRVAYAFAILLIIAGIWAYYTYAQDKPVWLLAFLLIFLIPPMRMQAKRRLISLHFDNDHLTMESGVLSRTRRTLDLAKVQDVTVKQTFGQRLLGVGDLMLESAGESGRMAILNVDNPRGIADRILAGSKRSAITRTPL